MSEGHIFIDEEITPSTLADVKQKLAMYAPKEKIVVHIQSPGGSVYAGYNIYHALKSSGKPIECIIEGEAQSMATFIALAASPGQLKICNPSVFMIHNPSSGMKGTAEDFESGASELRNIENDMVAAYVAKTGLPEDRIREMMRKTTTLTATQAGQMKFVDQVLGSYLTAAARGKSKNMKKSPLEIGIEKLAVMVGLAQKQVSVEAPDGVYTSKEGKTVSIKDGGIPESPTALDIPDGEYSSPDGVVITVTGGIITNVVMPESAAQPAPAPAPAPVPAPTQAAPVNPTPVQSADEITSLKNKLAEMEAAKAEAELKLTQQVTALGEIKKEVAVMKSKTVGDDEPPVMGLVPRKSPNAMAPNAKAKEDVMKFLNENMGWLKQYYPEGEFEKYASGPNMVSILETNFNYTYPGILTTEIFYKPTLQAPALSDIFTIDQGISFQKKYNLVTQLDKILQPYTGCTRTFNGNRQLITNTTVQVKEFQVSESWCKDDFTGQLTGIYNNLAQEWLKTGNRSFDPSGTPINTVIDRILTDALQRDVFRRVSFGAGNSSDSDYNQIDGLWDRLIDSSGASNYCVVRAGSALGTGTLAANAALTALEAVYAGSNVLLKNAPGKKFFVTRSIWDNYYNSLIANGAVTQVTEASFENLQKGLQTLTYKGIPVIPVDLWDFFLAESDNPLYATTRHLVLLTVKENHILGVEQGNDLNKIEGWYERKDRKFYYEADMKFGYNYLHCDLQTIAY